MHIRSPSCIKGYLLTRAIEDVMYLCTYYASSLVCTSVLCMCNPSTYVGMNYTSRYETQSAGEHESTSYIGKCFFAHYIWKCRIGILLPKLFWPTVRKNCSSVREKLLKIARTS